MRNLVHLATLLLVVATFGCGQPSDPPPTPTIFIPPGAISDLQTAVTLVSTQTAGMRGLSGASEPAATATGTPPPTAEEGGVGPSETETLASASVPRPPAPARLPAPISAADSAPCALGQVKGNASSMIFHVPGGGSYARTKANVVCFDSEEQAVGSGYRKARN